MNTSAEPGSSNLKQWPILLWAFNFFVGFVFYRMDMGYNYLGLIAIASFVSFIRHKGTFTISAMIWLFVSFQSGIAATEPILWLLPMLAVTNALLTFYFTQFPYVNSRTNLLGRGDRVEFQGKAIIISDDIRWTGDVETISTSGMSIRGDCDLKIGDIVDVEILDLRKFKSKAKVVGGSSPLLRFQFVGLNFGSVTQHLKVRQHVRETIKSKAGYSLLEVMIVAGVGSIMMLAANQIFMDTSAVEKNAQQDFWIESLKNEIITNIRDPIAWKNTLASPSNSTANCLRDKTPCNAVGLKGPLAILDANGNVVFDGTSVATGFTAKGNLCNTYDTGSRDCTFRFNISWQPVCSGACINPDVKIDITFASRNGTGRQVAMNSNARSLTFYRTPIYDSVEETCTSIGGTFSAATGNCEWTRLDANCVASGKILVGFDAAGKPICEVFPERECAEGTWLVGFKANGDLLCENR